MSEIPTELKYLPSHEWARVEDNGALVAVGITDYAQNNLVDIVYFEPPEVGSSVTAGEPAAVIESVKAASDINSPISGEVVAVNTLLDDEPELVNKHPYGDGWLFKVKPTGDSQLEKDLGKAMDSTAYQEQIDNE